MYITVFSMPHCPNGCTAVYTIYLMNKCMELQFLLLVMFALFIIIVKLEQPWHGQATWLMVTDLLNYCVPAMTMYRADHNVGGAGGSIGTTGGGGDGATCQCHLNNYCFYRIDVNRRRQGNVIMILHNQNINREIEVWRGRKWDKKSKST